MPKLRKCWLKCVHFFKIRQSDSCQLLAKDVKRWRNVCELWGMLEFRAIQKCGNLLESDLKKCCKMSIYCTWKNLLRYSRERALRGHTLRLSHLPDFEAQQSCIMLICQDPYSRVGASGVHKLEKPRLLLGGSSQPSQSFWMLTNMNRAIECLPYLWELT